ncbi:hypothetical protein [Microbulbifer yueqingensis]|uniref:Uncharacterized protein n=1 Tax=Microbulbifer yueqingensis TaxID=658219 RepID=A0A1G8X8J5_9GAMM|nr:hypothetical protein [Microbulbifer yueqingensis]SDJ86823.1 hypothetical protein SAMN05216212_1003 [Microbulbifer yueqingensis]
MARRRPARLSLRVRRRAFRATPLCRRKARVRWLWKQRTRVRSYKRLFNGEEESVATSGDGAVAAGKQTSD